MIKFLEENGFPMSIFIETTEFKNKNFEGYASIITDNENNILSKFKHIDLHARIHWANGFFTALKMINKFNKIKQN